MGCTYSTSAQAAPSELVYYTYHMLQSSKVCAYDKTETSVPLHSIRVRSSRASTGGFGEFDAREVREVNATFSANADPTKAKS